MHSTDVLDCSRFPDQVHLRVPRGLRTAIKAAAAKRFTSPAEWTRQKLLAALEEDGVSLMSLGHQPDAENRIPS